jgi:hypothetical protein
MKKNPFESAAGIVMALMAEIAVKITAKSFGPDAHAMVIVTTPQGDTHMAPTMTRDQVRALLRRRIADTCDGA